MTHRIIVAVCFVFLTCLRTSSAAELPGKWQVRSPAPVPRSEVAAAEINGKIYLLGGYVKYGDMLEEYDPAKDSWGRRASLPKPLHHIGAAAVNGKIYLLGGYITGVGSVTTVYEYDPAVDRWSAKRPMPTPRDHHAVGVVNGKLYAIAGRITAITIAASQTTRNTMPKPTAGSRAPLYRPCAAV